MYSLNNSESRKISRSLEQMNWWTTEARNRQYQFRSGSSMSEDREIRNGWLTLPEDFKARFQQRQMMEKEQKMVAVYEAQQARALTRVSALSTSASTPATMVDSPPRQGKVRQMFEERRTKAGIDKSYPLQPIQNNGDRAQNKRPLNGHVKMTLPTTKDKKPVKAIVSNSHSIRKQKSDLMNGSGDVNHNTHISTAVSRNNNSWSEHTRASSTDRLDGFNDAELNNRLSNLEDETFPEDMAPSPSPRTQPSPPPRAKKAPASDRRSPAVSKPAVRAPPRAAASRVANSTSRQSPSDNTVSRASPQESVTGRGGAMSKSAAQPGPSSSSPSKGRSSVGPLARKTASSGGADGQPCSICGRSFATDRIEKHEEICKKAQTKKRKPYDALKHRLAGTEAEPFIRQIRKLPPPGKAPSAKTNKPLNSTWRQKHEDFIRAIRAAKQVQAHVAAGGKLSDLPPPPPSENPDYVQCPHCNRRFNQGAAERHIPKCKDYQFNKPKRR